MEIPVIFKIVPDAYHGTSKPAAQKIISTGQFEPSTDPDLYLGDGVYFFESSIQHAIDWARKKFGVTSSLGIIRAAIKMGRCLNLTLPEHQVFCLQVKEELEGYERRDWTDAAVINYIAENIVFPDTVRAVFLPGAKKARKMFPGSHFFKDIQIFICVKSVDNILQKKLCHTC